MTANPTDAGPVESYSFVLVSPREPSGVSWMINCLLELGIRVDLQPTGDQIFGVGRQPASAIWLPEPDGRWKLHPFASALKKWLPILSRTETLTFRPEPRVLHLQTLPQKETGSAQVILFVRDLRDALHSLYRRLQPSLSWQEFVDWPQSETLLDAIDHWRLFIECWLDQSPLFVGRFEDYKADATQLLKRVLEAMRIDRTPDEIARATENSSFAAAAAAEARYRETHARDQTVANRAGTVGEWKKLPDLQPTILEMEQRAGALLARLGYRTSLVRPVKDTWERLAIFHRLSAFERFEIPADIAAGSAGPPREEQIASLIKFARELTTEQLARSPFDAETIRSLLGSLEEFSAGYDSELASAVRTLKEAFAEGSTFHLARIRALYLSRQPRPESSPS